MAFNIPARAQAAYDAMKAAEAAWKAVRTGDEVVAARARAEYDAANAAYNIANPPRGSFRGRELSPAARAGRRAQQEQEARTAESERRAIMSRSWR